MFDINCRFSKNVDSIEMVPDTEEDIREPIPPTANDVTRETDKIQPVAEEQNQMEVDQPVEMVEEIPVDKPSIEVTPDKTEVAKYYFLYYVIILQVWDFLFNKMFKT